MVVVPVVAVAVAENAADTLHVGVHVGGFGVNTTLTPLGRAERLKVTGAAVPAVRVALRVSVADAPPWVIDSVAGVAWTVKANVVVTTVNENVVVAVVVPLVPVTVIVVVPVVAVAVAEKAAETLHVGVQVGGLGVKTTLTPLGRAERLNVTGAATPAVRVALSVSVPAAPPCVIDNVAGVAWTVKAKVVATTVKLNVVVAVVVPLVPVTVIVVVPVVAVAVAENAAETLHVGVQVGGLGVNTTLTPVGRADKLNVTGAATPAVRVADKVSVPAAPP